MPELWTLGRLCTLTFTRLRRRHCAFRIWFFQPQLSRFAFCSFAALEAPAGYSSPSASLSRFIELRFVWREACRHFGIRRRALVEMVCRRWFLISIFRLYLFSRWWDCIFYIGDLDMSHRPNQSPEPTAVDAVCSAVAVHGVSRRWLSFFR